MPINEILAPAYVKAKYATPAYPQGHAFRLYFASGCSWSPGLPGQPDNWRLMEGATDHGAITGILHQIFTRIGNGLPEFTAFTQIELWHSIPSAPNVLDHLNVLPDSNEYGDGAGVAASYLMYVFAGALRPTFRMTFFDGASASPQKYPPTTAPDVDNGTIHWYMTKSSIPFATQDGIRITREVSGNTGYNRKLARSYGRTISP